MEPNMSQERTSRFVNPLLQGLFTAVFLVILLFVFGKLLGSLSLNLNSDNFSRSFTVEGSSKSTEVPKIAQTQFSITESGTTQKEAQDKGNDKQNKAMEMLTSLGIDKKDIKTLNYYVNEDFDYTQSGRVSRGYTINISTSVKSKDVEKINTAISRLTELGINIGGIQFVSDDSMDKTEARKKAIEDAQNKAQELAKAAGFKVGKLLSINEYSDTPPGPYYSERAVGMGGGAATDIQPGSNEVTYRVSITYQIDN